MFSAQFAVLQDIIAAMDS